MTDYNNVPSLTQTIKEVLELVRENAYLRDQITEYETYNPYKRGKLYILRNSVDEMVYVGSTTQELYERMKDHRTDSKMKSRKSKLYVHMRKLGRDKFTITLLRLAPCKSKWHLENEEYAAQIKIAEKTRLFFPKKRLPIGLTPAEKCKLWYYRKLKEPSPQKPQTPLQTSEASALSDTQEPREQQ